MKFLRFGVKALYHLFFEMNTLHITALFLSPGLVLYAAALDPLLLVVHQAEGVKIFWQGLRLNHNSKIPVHVFIPATDKISF